MNHNDLLSTAKQLQDLLELDVEKRRSQGEESLDYTPVVRDLEYIYCGYFSKFNCPRPYSYLTISSLKTCTLFKFCTQLAK